MASLVRRILISLVVLALVPPAISWASTTKYPTVFTSFKLKTTSSKRTFKGTIDSPKGKCVKNRKVKVIRTHNGNQHNLGTDKTGNGGKFAIEVPRSEVKNGKYFAKVKKLKFDGGKKVCNSRESPSVKVSKS
jgi:5-hydroxyisourate hydrolase-like protein (transthyretin family)